jgi:hypothetical protein
VGAVNSGQDYRVYLLVTLYLDDNYRALRPL